MHARDHASELGTVRTGLALTAVLCVAELAGGWLTNSLALMSDAAHMFTDLAALGLALFALRIAVLPASDSKTFGYFRAEILAALVNGVVLCVIVLFIGAEAWRRLHDPPDVAGAAEEARNPGVGRRRGHRAEPCKRAEKRPTGRAEVFTVHESLPRSACFERLVARAPVILMPQPSG